jgi:hypothetical protein
LHKPLWRSVLFWFDWWFQETGKPSQMLYFMAYLQISKISRGLKWRGYPADHLIA